jgi:uncharacterized protein (DUF433 family)
MMPVNEYVQVYNGGYYVAGTRIPLDVIVHSFRRGKSAEAIFTSFPSIGSLAKVYGTITFILEHPAPIEEYLKDQERVFDDLKSQFPMPTDLVERLERAMAEKTETT